MHSSDNSLSEVSFQWKFEFKLFPRKLFNIKFSGLLNQWWLTCAASFLWSIWLARNELVFNKKRLSFDEIMFLATLHSFYWVKASKEGCIVIESQWWSNPRLCVPCLKGVGPRFGIVWHAPPCGVIKFTVDGAACGKSGPAGCGGVLRDHSGKF
ncbi:hypothetical protein ES288_D11G360600v1 [Gossypium darwinii]|uniref:RNase H type-1 domain-containing protein n=2 Tax=Gossypium TaxID=3633 RepID=A0A5D2ATA0_GOSDA|nr:hypothetical protein ES288_D11G360600v1 [Gossypium darwinii]